MIVRPLPGDEATPGQIKALKNILQYKTGGVPSEIYLKVEKITLEDWYLKQFNKHSGIELNSLEELDRDTASKLISELIK